MEWIDTPTLTVSNGSKTRNASKSGILKQAFTRNVLKCWLGARLASVETLPLTECKIIIVLYILSDFSLISNVIQTIQNNKLNKYQLELAYFAKAQKYAWINFFKNINKPIPLIPDPQMFRII